MKSSKVWAFAWVLVIISNVDCSNKSSNSSFGVVYNSQPMLGYRSVKILEEDKLKFKDLNRNGQLDPYEDWRLSFDERVKDLVSKMSLEEKAGFMIIGTTRMKNDWSFQQPKTTDPITSDFNEEDQVMEVNMFTRKPLPEPMMSACGTTKAVTQFHERHFILRANPSARIIAEWANKLQALCESDGLGIPAIVASNPRNHITMDASIGLSVGKTDLTTWPGELGLAAMRDFSLVHDFADISRSEWAAIGLRKGYMYMADLATEPRWQRVEGTFGEDAQLSANMIKEIVLGFQGSKLDSNSVALTIKHFPGGGATEGGQDPHFEWGKREIFPGGMLKNNIIPFKAAIDAGTSSIMPYYSFPVGTDYPELAYAYNKPILQNLLRGELGFEGIINSDTGPIDMMPWGVEDLDIPSRYAKAIDAGVDLFSGIVDPTRLIETLKANPVLMTRVDESVARLLLEKFSLGLFENPYVDEESVESKIGKDQSKEKAKQAMRKSIVLLRNEVSGGSPVLPLKPKTKLYFEIFVQRGKESPSTVYRSDAFPEVEFVDAPEKADKILLWLIPKSRSLFQSDGSPLFVSLSKNGIDVSYVNKLLSKKPALLAINFTNPWAIDEVFNSSSSNIKGVLATFGTTPEALLDIVIGKFNPTGKMPFSTPSSEKAAQNQKSDVPGYQEGGDYELFKFDEGKSY